MAAYCYTGLAASANLRFPVLDPLRGLAALWVFLFHYRFSDSFRTGFPFLTSIFGQGDLGVPMFFVISGYCITATARSSLAQGESVGAFLVRRFLRIYPTYWCSILVVVAVPFVIELLSAMKTGHYTPPNSDHLSFQYIAFGPLEWIRFATLTQAFYPVPEATDLQYKFTTLNAVYWTLALEVQFYLVVAAALAFRRLFYPLLALTTLLGAPFVLSPATYVTGVFLPYWPMFALGSLLVWATEAGFVPSRTSRPSARAAAIAAGLLGLAVMTGGHGTGHLGFSAGFALLLVGVKAGPAWRPRLIGPVLYRLGLMSYSLYLIHARVQYIVAQLMRQVVSPDSVAFDVAAVGLTCVVCYLFYLCCEAPFVRLIRRRTSSKSGQAVQSTTPILAGVPA